MSYQLPIRLIIHCIAQRKYCVPEVWYLAIKSNLCGRLASNKGRGDLSLQWECMMTHGFILYMHREEYYNCNVTACKCFKCLLFLFFFSISPSFHMSFCGFVSFWFVYFSFFLHKMFA